VNAKTDSATSEIFPAAYLQRCRAARRDLAAAWTPAVGDWVLRAEELQLLDEGQVALGDALSEDRGVCWVPRLDQLLALLNAVSPHTVLDSYRGDFACICFDELSRRIADVVAETPELACLQAFLFIRAELAANESSQDW
jgi:hypothetical protein